VKWEENIDFKIEPSWIFGCEFFEMNNHFLFNKPKMMVFHKCLMDYFDKILSIYIGNTILIDHNLTRMMKIPINNVMLVEKWNWTIEVFSKYLMGGILPLFGASSFHKWVFVYICGMQSFWYDMTNHGANKKFQRLLNPCSDHGNFSFYNMRQNDYGCKFSNVYQNLITTSPFSVFST